ncbi:hypothetical protein, partial [Telmatospirillum sp. J64-1]|uniref:hypothetical protein n=1 Tax=Telmatospirillum sp. J64-1 TaxID=2502183 RepID=UPI00163D9741
LPGLKLLPPTNDSTDLTLDVWAAATEGANGDVAVSGPQQVVVDIGVVAPSVSGSGQGLEDEWIALDLSASVNAEIGNETLSVHIEDLPAHAVLRLRDSGTILIPDTDGCYDVTAHLDNLEIRWDWNSPQRHSDEDISFNLRAVVTDTDGDSNQTLAPVTVEVAPVADEMTITAGGSGNEDTAIAVNVSIALTDLDGSEQL